MDLVKRQMPKFTAIPKNFSELISAGLIKIEDVGLWYILDGFADNQSKDCFPSIATLAERAGVSKDSIRRILKRLEEAGCITVAKRAGADGRQSSNLYTLIFFIEGLQNQDVSEETSVEGSQNQEGDGSKNDIGGVAKTIDELITHLTDNSNNLYTAKAGKRNIFEILCIATGSNYKELPRGRLTQYGKAERELKQLYQPSSFYDELVICETILKKALKLRERFSDLKNAGTLESLMKYWAELNLDEAGQVDRWELALERLESN